MVKARKAFVRALIAICVGTAALIPAVRSGRAAEKPRIQADNYIIDAVLDPQAHRLSAKAVVKITALDSVNTAIFELHNGLRLSKVLDSDGKTLQVERVSQDSTARVMLPKDLNAGDSSTLTFEYEGVLNSVDDSPVQGVKLASVSDPISYLLYAGRWFPVVGYGTNRFTAMMHVTVPAGFTVIGSGGVAPGVSPSELPPPPPPSKAVEIERKTEATAPSTSNPGATDGPVLRRRAGSTSSTATSSEAGKSESDGPVLKRKTPADTEPNSQASTATTTTTPAATASAEKPQDTAAAKSSDSEAPVLRRRTAQAAEPKASASTTKSAAAAKRKPGTTTASKSPAKSESAASKKLEKPAGSRTYTFTWEKASFPGTIIAGRFQDTVIDEGAGSVHVYFTSGKAALARDYGQVASKEFGYFTTLYGVPLSSTVKLVELPDDTVPSAWAPEIAAIASRAISQKANYRLVANSLAHQWWGVDVSPATKNDFWITEGGSRYAEARYIEYAAGRAGAQEAVKDMSVGALAYESVPLSQIGTMDTFDPVFQAMVTDKGGMIFHMLRWVLGEQKYDQVIRAVVSQYVGKSVSLDDFRKATEQVSGEQLAWFFSQWLDSTGAPEFKNKYTIFRTAKGFRIVGQITQDLDLFRMPVEMKIDTDGKTETKRIEVIGTDSSFQVETFGKPRRITIDPNDWVLKNSSDLRMRSGILRGQQLVAQGNLSESLREFQKALDVNKNSSLAHYRIAEVFYLQRNYQAAANAYRDALNGDGEPKWTEVWSHIQLGKIFDVSGQRERAVNEYRQAMQTNDNTQGALDEARKYLQSPFTRGSSTSGMQ